MTRKYTCLLAVALLLAAVWVAPRASNGSRPKVEARPKVKLSAARVNAPGREDEDNFMRRVYEAQVARAKASGSVERENLPDDQLELVETRYRMRKDAAGQCRLLLEEARADLNRQKEKGDPEALQVSRIGIYSAYRSIERDKAAWRATFRKHFRKTKDARAGLRGGEYGDEAVRMMVKIMRQFKAAPGFSKHTGGTAVDFTTTEGGVSLTANSNQNARWRNSWLHKWLTKNARKFKFKPLSTEAWHWEYANRRERRAGIYTQGTPHTGVSRA